MRAWLVKVNGKPASLHRFKIDAKKEAATWRNGCHLRDCPDCYRVEVVRLNCTEDGSNGRSKA